MCFMESILMNPGELLTGKVISGIEAEPIVDRAGNALAVKIRTGSASSGVIFQASG